MPDKEPETKGKNKEETPWTPSLPKEKGRMPNVLEPRPFLGEKRDVGESSVLANCYHKMQVRNSPLEGYGVFATDTIKIGEILEEVPIILWPRMNKHSDAFYDILKADNFISKDEIHKQEISNMFGFKHPSKYYFKWFPPNSPKNANYECLPLGYGPIYNSANGFNNATWTVKEKTFVFTSSANIFPGEEIFTYYGYMVADKGATFNIDEVFGFGLEYAALNAEGALGVLLRNLRFETPEAREIRMKEPGCQELMNCLKQSGGRIKLEKISVIDNGEENHVFEFPPEFNLLYTFMKLKEFKQTRFKVIKFTISFVDLDTKKLIRKEILYVNHNG